MLEQPGALDGVTELRPEERREGVHRQEESRARPVPLPIGAGEGPARHEIVDMGVGLQRASPGVEHAEEAGLIAEAEAGVGGERLDRCGGSGEERLIADPGMATKKRPQRLGNGKGEHEVVGGQRHGELAFEPLVGFAAMAGGAVAIAAAAGDAVGLAAGTALEHDAARLRGAAGQDRSDHLALRRGHRIAEALEILRCVGEKDFCSAPISEPSHDRVDERVGVLVALAGEVQVDHGGLQAGMPEVALDDAQVHLCSSRCVA